MIGGQRLPLVDAADGPRWYVLAEPAEDMATTGAPGREPGAGEVTARRVGAASRREAEGEEAAPASETILTSTGKDR
jgi:hypothetical protein